MSFCIDGQMADRTVLGNHAQVLLCIANGSGSRLRDIGERVGITERAAHGIVGDLAQAGYISRERRGRRNHYTIATDLPLRDPLAREQTIGELLRLLTRSSPRPGEQPWR